MDMEDAIANLQRHNQMKATEAVAEDVRRLSEQLKREQDREAAMPQCPYCGGRIPAGFAKCKNCASDLIWFEEFPGKPGQEELLKQLAEQKAAALEAEAAALCEKQIKEHDNGQAMMIAIVVFVLLFGFVGVLLTVLAPLF